MKDIQEKILELMKQDGDAHSILYGKKIVDGVETDDLAIVHAVEEKKPIDQIPKEKIIPKTININGQDYKTDVIEMGRFTTKQCNSLTDSNVLYLSTKIRPLSGGINISNLATWNQVRPFRFTFNEGTLGFLAIDNTDGSIVGVTNHHVAVIDAFLTSERDINGKLDSITDEVTLAYTGGLNITLHPTILQFDQTNSSVNFINDKIGSVKRYVPIGNTITNRVDAALIALNASTIDKSSASQAELQNSKNMPFASTAEIDSLLGSSVDLYSVGRTTGLKGPTCPLRLTYFGATALDYNKQGTDTRIIISECGFVHFPDNSNLPIYSGDSGSAIIANFSGTYKIVGLIFAADVDTSSPTPKSTFGVFCRIDNVASELNISAWLGQDYTTGNSDIQNASFLYRPASDNRKTITYNGKTYYQAGLVANKNPITSA